MIGSSKSMQSIKKYRTTLQKINLTFQNDINYAYLMVGRSKCGMTSAAHYLSGNKLTGYKANGEPMVQVDEHQLKKQKIGKSYQTQTQVPNKFQIKLKNMYQKVYLIDGPGFDSTNGALGILSNAYAHLKFFEKVKNIRFILCFNQSDLHGDGSAFIETVRQFIGLFTKFEDIKKKIIPACSFLFIKTKDREKLKLKLTHIVNFIKPQLNQAQLKQIKEIINQMIALNRISSIKQAEVGQIIQSSTLMNDINTKLNLLQQRHYPLLRYSGSWWNRDLSQQKKEQKVFSSLDMKPIKISLMRQLQISCISGQKSKSQYAQLINYYKQMINMIFHSIQQSSKMGIRSLLNILAKDFISEPNNCTVFDKMKQFIKEYTFDNGQQTLGNALNQVKNNKISTLESYNISVNTLRKTVKKFQALKNIQKINKNNENLREYITQINEFRIAINWLNQILKQVHKVALWYQKQDIIKKYFYELSQLINELRYMQMIFQQDKKQCQILSDICKIYNPNFSIFRSISDELSQSYCFQDQQYTSGQLLKLYTQRLDIVHLQQKGYVIDQYFVQWMFSEQEVDDQKCKKSLIILMERYSDMILQRLQLQQQSNGQRVNYPVIYTEKLKKQLFLNLYKARQWAQKLYYDYSKPQVNRFYIIKFKRISKNMAELFLHKYENNLAIKFFDSVNMVSSVCSTFEKWIKFTQADNPMQSDLTQQKLKLKLIYVDYLQQHCCIQKAIHILNEIISDERLQQQKLQQISKRLMKLRDKKYIQQKNSVYASILSDKQYFKQTNGDFQSEFDEYIECQFGNDQGLSQVNFIISKQNMLKFKLMFVGDQAVGKSSIITRFIKNEFDPTHNPTIGVDFVSKNLNISGTVVRLQLWDTAGQQRFRSLIPGYLRDCQAAFIVFDLTYIETYQSVHRWIDFVKQSRGDDSLIYIIGNKADLQQSRAVNVQQALQRSKQWGCKYFEVSAKNGTNLEKLFKEVCSDLLNINDKPSENLSLQMQKKQIDLNGHDC